MNKIGRLLAALWPFRRAHKVAFEMDSYSDIGGREENEDSCGCGLLKNGAYAVVADGLGGHGGGSMASRLAVDCLTGRCQTGLPTPEGMERWLQEANQTILEHQDDPNRMKTTAVCLCIQGDRAIWGHVGDSRLYHYHNGAFQEVTRDHSVTQIAVMQGEITREEMPFHPDRNRLIRALGSPQVRTEVHTPVVLAPGLHAFLLCSDGFWECIREADIPVSLQEAETPGQWIAALRVLGDRRREQMTHVDNHTAVAVWTWVE